MKQQLIIILDFDGIFVPLEIMWDVLDEYAQLYQLKINKEHKNYLLQHVVTNQSAINQALLDIGIKDLKKVSELYYHKTQLNQGVKEFFSFLNSQTIKYKFYSGASTERIQSSLKKYNIVIDQTSVINAHVKNESELQTLKQKIQKENPDITDLLYIDDYPPALEAAKKNKFVTVYMKNDFFALNTIPFKAMKQYIDYQVNNLNEFLNIIKQKLKQL